MTSDVVENSKVEESASRKPFWRQVFICSGLWTSAFMNGLCLGSPTVLIPQVRMEANSTEVISDEMASWLSSTFIFGSLPWVILLPVLVELVGRKRTFILTCISACTGFTVLYCSTSPMQILISEIINSVIMAWHATASAIIAPEYTSPKYRGLFLTVKSATMYWGIWAANAIGTFFHWKNIGLFGLVCSSYSLVSIWFWPESPIWLATKGRFEECATSHRWLKGTDIHSEKELENLIISQKEHSASRRMQSKISVKESAVNFFKTIMTKEFYKSTLLAMSVLSLYAFSGKLVCNMYALDILKKMTGDNRVAYIGMLILDGVSVVGMYIGCILSKLFKRRPLLLTFSLIGISFLFIISLYLYLIKLSLIQETATLSITLLVIFSLSMSCGPIITSSLLHSELLPIRFRSLSSCMIATYMNLLLAILLKIAPFLFKTLGLHGTFMFYGICCTVLVALIYKYLPETKDKTLHEISECMRKKSTKEVVKLVQNNTN